MLSHLSRPLFTGHLQSSTVSASDSGKNTPHQFVVQNGAERTRYGADPRESGQKITKLERTGDAVTITFKDKTQETVTIPKSAHIIPPDAHKIEKNGGSFLSVLG